MDGQVNTDFVDYNTQNNASYASPIHLEAGK